jgi:hypothetical protein
MKLAIAAAGADRQRLIQLAMAWRKLARAQPGSWPSAEQAA